MGYESWYPRYNRGYPRGGTIHSDDEGDEEDREDHEKEAKAAGTVRDASLPEDDTVNRGGTGQLDGRDNKDIAHKHVGKTKLSLQGGQGGGGRKLRRLERVGR